MTANYIIDNIDISNRIFTVDLTDNNLFSNFVPSYENTLTKAKELLALLEAEFKSAIITVMFDTDSNFRKVILFSTPLDCLAFTLKYGHIYGLEK